MLHSATQTRRVIDLHGPEGNAFVLIGTAKHLAVQLEFEQERIDALMEEMTTSYVNLVRAFEREFGQFFDIIVPEQLEKELMEEDHTGYKN